MKNLLINLFTVLITFYSPIIGIMLSVGIVIGFDTIIGVYSAKRRRIKITSRKLRKGLIPKLLWYQLAILSLYPIDYFLLNDVVNEVFKFEFFFTRLLGLILVYIEFKSIDEHVVILTGKSIIFHLKELINKTRNLKNDINDIKQ